MLRWTSQNKGHEQNPLDLQCRSVGRQEGHSNVKSTRVPAISTGVEEGD